MCKLVTMAKIDCLVPRNVVLGSWQESPASNDKMELLGKLLVALLNLTLESTVLLLVTWRKTFAPNAGGSRGSIIDQVGLFFPSENYTLWKIGRPSHPGWLHYHGPVG